MVNVSEDTRDALDAIARVKRISRAELLRRLIGRCLEEELQPVTPQRRVSARRGAPPLVQRQRSAYKGIVQP